MKLLLTLALVLGAAGATLAGTDENLQALADFRYARAFLVGASPSVKRTRLLNTIDQAMASLNSVNVNDGKALSVHPPIPDALSDQQRIEQAWVLLTRGTHCLTDSQVSAQQISQPVSVNALNQANQALSMLKPVTVPQTIQKR